MDRISKMWMAVQHVRRARNLLRECGCKPAADTMARALKSVEGAHRYAIEQKAQADAVHTLVDFMAEQRVRLVEGSPRTFDLPPVAVPMSLGGAQ